MFFMTLLSFLKKYVLPVGCGVLLFFLVFSRFQPVKAAPLTGGNSDVGIFWLFNMVMWVDDTTDANDADAASDVNWTISITTRPMYIGHLTTKFNKVILDVSLAVDESGWGVDLPVFYWNGADWVDLPLDAQTHPLDTVGVNSFSFSAPADWETTDINGTTAYYIRFGTGGDGRSVNNAQVSQISLQTVTPPGVTVTESGGSTSLTEAGATDTYTVVLNAAPASAVTVAVSPDAYSTVSTSSIRFSTTNWDTPVTVTATAVNNNIAEGTHTSTITHSATSADADYDGITIASVTSTITDNDTAGVTIASTDGATAVTEGGSTDDITVVLTSAPTSTVTVTLTPNSQITLSTSSIEFSSANWDVAVTSTITAVNDSTVEGTHSGSISYSVASANWNYNGISVDSTSVSITDNDTAAETTTSNGNSVPAPPAPPVLTLPANLNTGEPAPAAPPIVVAPEGNKPVPVSVGGESHTVTQVGVATASQITLIIRSEPITVTLFTNSSQTVDTDKDGTPDLKLLYKGLQQGKPQVEMTALTEVGENLKPVSINAGAETTSRRDVKITLRAQNVQLIGVSEDPTFAGSSFVAYAPTVDWTLSPGSGTKTVYIRFRSPEGGTIDASDSIVLQSSSGTCPLTPGKVYKTKDAPGIYYIVGPRDLVAEAGDVPCTKRPFKNPRTYFSYFTSYSEAKIIDKKVLDSVANDPLKFMAFGPLEKLQNKAVVKQVVNSKVYILIGNTFHWIENENVFNAMGLKWNAIIDISSGLFDKFTEGKSLSSADDPLVR